MAGDEEVAGRRVASALGRGVKFHVAKDPSGFEPELVVAGPTPDRADDRSAWRPVREAGGHVMVQARE